ncbi:putative membrane protein YesL [Evansella vedderi]|uniref:Membrane protein YesL n=1 Tax=Evansella vedderi TaxID=38282 RepID=A0ABT9ZXA4_9BACI|nr:YesL family protein [Evansella vedderi]MDQ0255862.1 putative membrane protein YesL [Evansella vedderi]
MFNHIGSFFTESSYWIWRMMQLNWLWLSHILLGGVVLGVFPATAAMFAMTRKWLRGELDQPLFRDYHHYYRQNFWKVNGLGWIYFAIGAFLAFDLHLVSQMNGVIALVSSLLLVVMSLVYLFSFFYLFSYYVHFNQTFKHYLIQPFILTLLSFKQNLLIAIGLGLVGYLIYNIPGLIPFTLGVMPSYWVMKVSLNRFREIQAKSESIVGGTS